MHKIAVVEMLTGIHDVLIVFFLLSFAISVDLLFNLWNSWIHRNFNSLHLQSQWQSSVFFFVVIQKRNLILHIYSLFHTYFFTGIFPVLSACRHNLVCALSKKSVAEPFNWLILYANFIISSVQCWNDTERTKNVSLKTLRWHVICYLFNLEYLKLHSFHGKSAETAYFKFNLFCHND